MRIAVTGSSGYIGSRLVQRLLDDGHTIHPVDDGDDIMDDACLTRITEFDPDLVYHLAAHKYATQAEIDPYETVILNVHGTQRIATLGFPVILASTCKAGNAITCYGASKLIAERIVLNVGGRVLRLVNVLGSTGSVVEIWRRLPEDAPLPVTGCSRMWITAEQAVAALIEVPAAQVGKYIPHGERLLVSELAARLYPDRKQEAIGLRRGDRIHEPLCSSDQYAVDISRQLLQIKDVWDGE